jgi:hypothetical protein
VNNRTYLYAFIATVAAFAFFILGFFAFTPKDIELLRTQDNTSPKDGVLEGNSCTGDSCQVQKKDNATFSGRVSVIKDVTLTGATHELDNDVGEPLAYLYALDDKLKMVEGFEVNLVGTITNMIGKGVPLLQVEKIKFKND